jgi:hypothetical protein
VTSSPLIVNRLRGGILYDASNGRIRQRALPRLLFPAPLHRRCAERTSNYIYIFIKMAWHGTDHRRFYLVRAVLPEMTHGAYAPSMPPVGHKSHLNSLSVRPERYRKLESMKRLKSTYFERAVTQCIFSSFHVNLSND